MELTTLWFVIIAFCWTAYLVLEGFDFGVGMWLGLMARDNTERRVLLNTIGPVWDGNEVWLLVAGGATFAAFPEWYATLFSGFYLPLLFILLALIVRNLGLEYRAKRDSVSWRRNWDIAIVVGSFVPALLWGVALANIVRGVPIDSDFEFTGTIVTLLNPYALLGGLTTLGLFLVHGAWFVSLKTRGGITARARRLGLLVAVPTAAVAVAFLVWTQALTGNGWSLAAFAIAVLAFVGSGVAALRKRTGWAFTGTFVTIAGAAAGLFVSLFPDVMPSTLAAANSLTTTNASATDYTLTIMTWSTVLVLPFVLAYQTWSYWVFRRRISVRSIPA